MSFLPEEIARQPQRRNTASSLAAGTPAGLPQQVTRAALDPGRTGHPDRSLILSPAP
jgi:hypothetical protein